MIYHAVLGSLGRFVAVLFEHYGGALPFWLAPEQVAVAPISRDQEDYAAEVVEAFAGAGLRAICYAGPETLSRRIVTAHDAAVPVMAILGRLEKAERRVTLRERDGTQSVLPLADAAAALARRRAPESEGSLRAERAAKSVDPSRPSSTLNCLKHLAARWQYRR